jgi:hypothetical protein
MNDYIKNRIELENHAKKEDCKGGDLDESYSGALWDWAGEIASLSLDEALAEELQEQIYYALQETFETLHKGA